MSFRIDIEGLDELQRELERMQEGLTVPEVDRWCKIIETQAKETCPEFKTISRFTLLQQDQTSLTSN